MPMLYSFERKDNVAFETEYSTVLQATTDKNTIEGKLLEQFECPICFQYMTPPIKQCVMGHSVCNSCKQKLPHCSICRGAFGETRNFILENLATNVNFCCKYKDAGCKLALGLDKLEAHQKDCSYRPRKCPMAIIGWSKCMWEGTRFSNENTPNTDTRGFWYRTSCQGPWKITLMDMKQNGLWCRAVFTLNEIFMSYIKTKNDSLYSIVFHVGDERKSTLYNCQLTFQTRDGCDKIISNRGTPSYVDINDVIRKEEFLISGYNFVKRCVTADGQFCYEVNIVPNAPPGRTNASV